MYESVQVRIRTQFARIETGVRKKREHERSLCSLSLMKEVRKDALISADALLLTSGFARGFGENRYLDARNNKYV